MIKGIGIDILKTGYIEEMLQKHGDDFLKGNFSPGEIQAFFRKKRFSSHYLAGRFAAKEAFVKAISTFGYDEISFPEIEIVNQSSGCPEFRIHNKKFDFLKENQNIIHLSISHHAEYAVAMVVIEQPEHEFMAMKE